MRPCSPATNGNGKAIPSLPKKNNEPPLTNGYKKEEPALVENKIVLPQTESKLFIQQPSGKQPIKEDKPFYPPVETEVVVVNEPAAATLLQSKTKRSLLSALRDKYGDQYNIEEIDEAEPLEMEKLRECWFGFAAKLEEQQKHSAANTFKMARLTIENETRVLITVSALVQQKFVEQEKTLLADCIQKTFHNHAIQLQIVVEDDVNEEVSPFLIMNSRERFNYIASQYPLVKELKDRLRLEIDSI